MNWPPNYTEVMLKRQILYKKVKGDKRLLLGVKKYYKDRPIEFINDWCMTYDPRNASSEKPTLMPFITFPRQDDFICFLSDCLREEESGLVEKTRDIGATWLCCAYSVWLWLFTPGSSVGWGSRKESLVDKLGDPDSIFEKIRMILKYLPGFLMPVGYDDKKYSSYMKLINPENGSTITGESGDNIGRGGRKLIYFKDESAHYERPELIEAALSHNTNVQIDLSSVNGSANIFARKRFSGIEWTKQSDCSEEDSKPPPGVVRVFIFDWRDHPAKTQEWYNKARKKAEREGLLHVFASETDRDYVSSVDNIVIPAKFIKAAIGADRVLGLNGEVSSGAVISALDVADEGGDKNAFTLRRGLKCVQSKTWSRGDTGETTKRAISLMAQSGCRELQYDCIGVGSGVKATVNLLKEMAADGDIIHNLKFVKWNAAVNPIFKDQRIVKGDKGTPKNGDFYSNLKAQAWWNVRTRFEKTYQRIVKGIECEDDELIVLDEDMDGLEELVKELSQPTYSTNNKGKLVIDKKPNGTSSPNRADSFIMCFFPLRSKSVRI